MYTLKSIAQRSTLLGAAFALVAAAFVPAAVVLADSLNPLTERSLLLSSSAPGYKDTDGSGNATYAPAGSGPNGKKTGQTFTFTASSGATIKGFSFQYCTTAAGKCQSPGNNDGDNRASIGGTPRVPDRDSNSVGHADNKSDLDFVTTNVPVDPNPPVDFVDAGAGSLTGGKFQVLVNTTGDPEDWVASAASWTFAKSNLETASYDGALTGKNNYVTLTSSTGQSIPKDAKVKIIFKASENVYITNPGSGSFFVKINTYSSDTSLVGSHNDATPDDDMDAPGHTVVNGGVTVANVMTDSIHITTKVLETMAFSVGTQNRDTVDIGTGQVHGRCDAILQPNGNRLNLGNPNAEYSLETGRAWDVYSYWRLSSNSSGGATVYYSGNTLANTVGDEIKEMATEVVSNPGTEQFGLGFVDAGLDAKDSGAATWAAGSSAAHQIRSFPFKTLVSQTGAPYASLAPQAASTDYDEATGTIYDDSGATVAAGTAKFKFLKSSLAIPEPIAQQDESVISCATAKMRYVANIGADTPAGVYTTKINYLAAPQY
jgi:hypothetical protein